MYEMTFMHMSLNKSNNVASLIDDEFDYYTHRALQLNQSEEKLTLTLFTCTKCRSTLTKQRVSFLAFKPEGVHH